jgi:hypothetical protein
MTHVENLPQIVAEGGLVCDAEAERRELCKQSIAYTELKQRRATRPVEKLFFGQIAAGGVLADYVPFYFTIRSPMLYAIKGGYVQHFKGRQSDVVYFVSSVEAIAASDRVWCFTNGHAVEGVTEFFDSLADLDKVDWEVIRDWSWQNTLADLDRKRRKQAEFLVHRRVPWKLITKIGVLNRGKGEVVSKLIAGMDHQPGVTVEPDWYYN